MILKVPSPGPVFLNFDLKGPVGSQGSPIKGFGFTVFWLVVGVVPKWSKQILRSKRRNSLSTWNLTWFFCWKTGERHDWALMTPSGSLVSGTTELQFPQAESQSNETCQSVESKAGEIKIRDTSEDARTWGCWKQLKWLKRTWFFSWIGHPWNDWDCLKHTWSSRMFIEGLWRIENFWISIERIVTRESLMHTRAAYVSKWGGRYNLLASSSMLVQSSNMFLSSKCSFNMDLYPLLKRTCKYTNLKHGGSNMSFFFVKAFWCLAWYHMFFICWWGSWWE